MRLFLFQKFYNAGAIVHTTIPKIVIALTKIQKILTIVFLFIKFGHYEFFKCHPERSEGSM
ncbi:MAG TPA: hypothetical protein DEB73_03970 [Candidatus Magasanikbacteria bacterium]|nr:hypothetical protein [Candidatus Magasanikbacteria bacterium]HBX15679.1 hypothetical protein [Candidatus Magasanikbacteria bacterium]